MQYSEINKGGDSTAGTFMVPLDEADPNDSALLGGKAASLAGLIQNGVNVPNGYVVTTEAFDAAAETGRVPDTCIDDVMRAINELGGAVALRSSATVEDGTGASMAGVFDTHYLEAGVDRQAIAGVVQSMYDQARSDETAETAALYGIPAEDIKLGVVVQELVLHPNRAGVVYVPETGDSMLVQYVDGYGNQLVDGERHGARLVADLATGRITDSAHFDELPLDGNSLQALTGQVNRVVELRGTGRDIEFAANGHGMRILQDRPIPGGLSDLPIAPNVHEMEQATRDSARRVLRAEMDSLGTDKALLHLGNFSELLPRPAPMDVGVFQYIFPGRNGTPGAIQLGRREMGYPLGDSSVGFLKYVGGRAYESLAGDSLTYFGGFPDTEGDYAATLVPEYLDRVYASPELAEYPEMGLYLQDPTHQDLASRFGSEAVTRHMQAYDILSNRIAVRADVFVDELRAGRTAQHDIFIEEKGAEDITGLSDEQLVESYQGILEYMRTETCVDFVVSARLGFYYTQRLKTTLGNVPNIDGAGVERLLAQLSQGLEGSAITDANIAISEARSDDDAYGISNRLVGHFAVGEALEICHPRFKEMPDALREYVDGIRTGDSYAAKFTSQQAEREEAEVQLLGMLDPSDRDEMVRVMKNAQTYMASRETIKDLFTKQYALVRERLEEIGSRAGLDEEQIYFAYPEEVGSLLQNPDGIRHLLTARAREFDLHGQLDMPRIIRHDTVHEIKHKAAPTGEFTETTGQFIADGDPVQGTVVNISQLTEAGHQPGDIMAMIRAMTERGEHVILAAEQINLTHDPLINQASGLVLQNAGFVSHGAQRARELGIGALSGVDTGRLTTGLKVSFDPATRRIAKDQDQ